MRKLVALFALMTMAALPTPGEAITDLYYGRAQGGMNFFEGETYSGNPLRMGPLAGIAVGYDFYEGIIFEVEMSMRRNTAKTSNVDPTTGPSCSRR